MDKQGKMQALCNEWIGCKKCPLLDGKENVVFGYGQYQKYPITDFDTGKLIGMTGQVLIVGEAPGTQEDREGIPFVGKSGRLLNQYLASVSVRSEVKAKFREFLAARGPDEEERINLELRDLLLQEFFFTNVVACRTPDNRDPTPNEISECSPRLMEIIYIVDPLVIIAVGRIAVQALINRKVSITQSRGEMYEVQMQGRLLKPYTIPLIAALHPSYLLRKNDFNQKHGEGAKTFRDFMKAMRIVDEFNFRNYGIPIPVRKEQD